MLKLLIMIASFIITFRETLEAALLVGIVVSYLNRVEKTNLNRYVYFGIIAGIGSSVVGAYLFSLLVGGFSGRPEEIFEGFLMIFGAILITSMILWMMKKSNIAKDIETKLDSTIDSIPKWSIFSVVFISTLREGIETVIFLGTTSIVSEENSLWGAILGILGALVVGFLIFKGSMRINLHLFFSTTSLFLIFVAAGLLAHGIQELQEARLVPIVIEHVYDVNPILDENGVFGGILKGLFGYNGNPSLMEFILYSLYLIVVFSFWRTIMAKKRESISL